MVDSPALLSLAPLVSLLVLGEGAVLSLMVLVACRGTWGCFAALLTQTLGGSGLLQLLLRAKDISSSHSLGFLHQTSRSFIQDLGQCQTAQGGWHGAKGTAKPRGRAQAELPWFLFLREKKNTH